MLLRDFSSLHTSHPIINCYSFSRLPLATHVEKVGAILFHFLISTVTGDATHLLGLDEVMDVCKALGTTPGGC